MITTIPVGLGARAYDVVVGTGLIDRAGEHIAPLLKRKRVAIVTDTNVGEHHGAVGAGDVAGEVDDGDTVERRRARAGRHDRVRYVATAATISSRWNSASPYCVSRALARLKYMCRSYSQVNPMPPWTCSEAAGTRQPASDA